jgi:serine/threonine protein kinase
MDQGDPFAVKPTFSGDVSTKAVKSTPPKLPDRISHYRVEKLLGNASFGVVYLAYDEQLHRAVAIKVPHINQVGSREYADPQRPMGPADL